MQTFAFGLIAAISGLFFGPGVALAFRIGAGKALRPGARVARPLLGAASSIVFGTLVIGALAYFAAGLQTPNRVYWFSVPFACGAGIWRLLEELKGRGR